MKVTDLLLLIFIGPWVVYFLGMAIIYLLAGLFGLAEWITRPRLRRRP